MNVYVCVGTIIIIGLFVLVFVSVIEAAYEKKI